MPTFQAFHATIRVDDKDLPEYDVQVDDKEKQVSCWIPSEVGKNFSACWSTPEFQTDLNGYVTLDGFSVGATSSPKGCKKERIKSSFYPSSTTICNFSFSAITLTDDDAYLDTSVANLGEIKIEIWTCEIQKGTASNKIIQIPASNLKVHERSKKVGSHHIQFSDLKVVPPVTFCKASKKIDRLVTFVFRYRPLGLLQANGIAPLPSPAAHPQQDNKRKSRDSDTEDINSTNEEEIDRRVKELKDELERLESRRPKKIKVEKREHSPRLNEVIDLT